MATDDVKLLTEYDEWKAERKRSANDLSPEAFFIDRAKEQALAKLIKIDELMDAYYGAGWGTTEEYEIACTILHDQISETLDE